MASSSKHLILRYPGEKLPPLPEWKKFPHPSIVGKYLEKNDFLKISKWPAQWVHYESRVNLVLNGKYYDIWPVHFEGIFTLRCTFMCPHCDQRPARERWSKDKTWNLNTPITPNNTMDIDNLKFVIREISRFKMDDYIGIVWGGGDPTTIPWVYEALRYSKSLNIRNSFLTNGVLMDPYELIEIEPDIVRVSLDCGSKEKHATFHGYPPQLDYFNQVIKNIYEFAKMKKERELTNTLFGISLIIDERNFEDSVKAAKLIREIALRIGQKRGDQIRGIDYLIVRPVMNYPHFYSNVAKINKETKKRAYKLINSRMKNILESVDVPVIPIKDSFSDPPNKESYIGSECLSYGWFSQILPWGDVQLCSDSYSNPHYTIGNVLENSLKDIWNGEKRKRILKEINEKQCFYNYCPFNSRGHHLNRILHQIEKKRQEDNMDLVKQWIEDLRKVTYPPSHSFFM